MINTLYPQIMGIITRIQNYPGIKGLEEVDARVRKICRDHNQPFPESIALFLKAYKSDRQDNLLDAVEHYKTCLDATQPEEVQLTVFVNGLLASVYNDCGEYQSAYACYAKALENLHLVDDNIRALIYCNLSDMHLSLGKFEEAKQYARKAVTSSQNANRQLDCAVSHLNLAYGCAYTGEFDQAIRARAIVKSGV
ncbi:tetratricopeptide repeat protein [Vibrio sp.]|uniref:tetratricopeptide repeat protein n=1 Tax=Vibrio sp. TaxID=678 RepID=UPI0037954F3A